MHQGHGQSASAVPARVGPFGASLDAGDDALDAAPAFGAVEELLEAAYFVISWRGLEASFCAGLEDFDVSAQGRGWRNAEDVIKAVRPTPVENLRAAVMAVGPQQDLSVGPVCADGAHETAQKSLDFLTAGPLGGPKDGGDEATLAVEHDDRLKAILVIMRVEQPQLLAAMHRVERVVDVERDSLGNPRVEEPGGTRNKDQPSPGPCAARRERSADFRAARSSIASTVPDRTATDRAPS